jgi:hypothetical protein
MVPPDSDKQDSPPGQPGSPGSGGSSSGPRRAPAPDINNQLASLPPEPAIEEFFPKIMALGWFTKREECDEIRLRILNQFARLETFAAAEGGGFQLTLKNGRNIHYTRGEAGELVTGVSDGFNSNDADAIVALAAVHGWNQITVQGNDHEKDLLWLAAKKQGLIVTNYAPAPQSDIIKEWDRLQNGGKDPAVSANGPAVTPSGPGIAPGDNAAPAPDAGTPDESGEQEPDFSNLDKDQLKRLHTMITAEEDYARAKDLPNLQEILQIKEAITKALKEKGAAPGGDDSGLTDAFNGESPKEAKPAPADAAPKPKRTRTRKTSATTPAEPKAAPKKDTPKSTSSDDSGVTDTFNGKAAPKDPQPAPADAAPKPGRTRARRTSATTQKPAEEQQNAPPAEQKPAANGGTGRHRAPTRRTRQGGAKP